MGVKVASASTGVVLLSAGVWFALNYSTLGGVEEAPTDDDDFALFTHARGELHCPDRELRHLCVPELRRFFEEGDAARQEAYDCAKQVLVDHKDDYWMLKNMTHLLLDLDGNVHVFDRKDRSNEFIELGMQFGHALMEHPDCSGEFDSKDPLECRCYPLYAKILLLKLKNADRWDEARELYASVTQRSWMGEKRTYGAGEAVQWAAFNQTPQIVMPNLRAMPVWPREAWDGFNGIPVAHKMEEHFATIREEAELVLQHAPEEWTPTYRFLFDQGDWSQVLLYNGREFRPECEQLFPKTCALLRQWLPSKPGLPWVSDQNEQVLILRLQPGTTVERHSGPSNSILNIHLGIKGLEGARLVVDGEEFGWEEGKVIAWDGSFDHTVDCLNCKQDRIIMMIRYMHPDVTAESYRGNTRTHFEDIDPSIFDH
jgi:aspartate beta-hydroxylase